MEQELTGYVSINQINVILNVTIFLIVIISGIGTIFYLLVKNNFLKKERDDVKERNLFLMGVHAGNGYNQVMPFSSSQAISDVKLLADDSDHSLTKTEYTILYELVAGKSPAVIAKKGFKSVETVRTHIRNIYKKLNVHSKQEAIAIAIKEKIVDINEVLGN